MTVAPSKALSAQTIYRVDRLGTGISGIDGKPLAQPYSWTFTTGSGS